MKHIILLIFFSAVIVYPTKAQIFIEPIAGFQKDFNNSKFNLVNTGLKFSFKESRHYELLVAAYRSWGFSTGGNDIAFTVNPALPLSSIAAKKIIPSAISIALGHRIAITGNKPKDKLSLLLYTGVTFQQFAVKYQYDKENYTILNPDGPLNRNGIYMSGGIEYMRMLNKGRLFFQLLAATPPSGKESKYPNSFHAMAPVNFQAGYSVIIQPKRK